MNNCKNCQTELFADNTPAGCALRCAICGSLTDAEAMAGKTVTYRSAWWSFGLGGLCVFLLVAAFALLIFLELPRVSLPSFLLLTISGTIAVILGVRSLFKMRYRNVSSSTKFAAIAGSILGGSFGVVLGGFCSVFGLIIFFIGITTEMAEGPEACKLLAAKMGGFEFPGDSSIRPYKARSSPLNFGAVKYCNEEKSSKGSFWLELSWFPKWTTANRGQFHTILESEDFDSFDRDHLVEIDREILNWEIVEQDAAVRMIKWEHRYDLKSPLKVTRLDQYYFLIDVDSVSIGATLMHNPQKTGYREDDIRSLLESFRLTSDDSTKRQKE